MKDFEREERRFEAWARKMELRLKLCSQALEGDAGALWAVRTQVKRDRGRDEFREVKAASLGIVYGLLALQGNTSGGWIEVGGGTKEKYATGGLVSPGLAQGRRVRE